MTIIPLSQSLSVRSSFAPNLPTITAAVRSLSASLPNTIMAEYAEPISQNAPKTLANYPKPISPPLPAISKDVEQSRAMSACSRSSLFSLRRSDILFEDQWLMAVNKPQGVYSETILSSANRMLNHSEGHDSSRSLHLANRLDRDTSGVMVITKSHQIAAKLMKAFSSRLVTKTYIALCIGPAPNWRTITVKSGHGRSKFGAWRVYAASDVGRALPNAPPVKDMETSFEVLSVNCQGCFKELPEEHRKEDDDDDEDNVVVVEERLELESNGNAEQDEILVRAFPRSGRTHQIRLHCQYLGMSIRGDVKYEGAHEWKGKVYDGHELHAESLSFDHPVTGVAVTFRAPLPPWAVLALHPSSFHQSGDKMVSQYEAPSC